LNWEWFESTFSSCLRDGEADGPATAVFSCGTEVGVAQWNDFRKRVVEHVSLILETFENIKRDFVLLEKIRKQESLAESLV